MAFNLATILGFLAVSGLALFVFLLVGKLVRPSKPEAIKATTYECGEKPFGPAWFNFNNRFYVIALVFVIFDVEVALVVPAVVVFRKLVAEGLGILAFVEIFLFLAILLVALIYVWAHGDLSWDRIIKQLSTSQPPDEPREGAK
ncbi:MAG TPA: NADH-quinone oxidoreductase subunit A [Myxococcota bacterium]|nr:NADH-quinone oxidoreductase subunit A [Myxococcota bacterium]